MSGWGNEKMRRAIRLRIGLRRDRQAGGRGDISIDSEQGRIFDIDYLTGGPMVL